MKRIRILNYALFSLLAGALAFTSVHLTKPNVSGAEAYTKTSIRSITTIDLNDCSTSDIKSYYSSLTSKSTSQKQGKNLLINLKNILKDGQQYFAYDGANLWDLYEISDRDLTKSPFKTGESNYEYNPTTNVVTNYQYDKVDPYVHSLYTKRSIDNQAKAHADHTQSNWGINQEHIWPKSQGFDAGGEGGARGDPMHLVSGNGAVNNMHSNYMYGYVDKNKDYEYKTQNYLDENYLGVSLTTGETGSNNKVFEPQDSDKGDIARAIFYMVARYNYLAKDDDNIDQNNPNLELKQSTQILPSYTSSKTVAGYQGLMTDLLNWNHIDPPDEYEIHRNNILYKNYTKNRNPFIDYPEWADYIWGSVKYDGRNYVSYDSSPTGYIDLNTDVINGFKDNTGVTISKQVESVNVGKTVTLSATSSDGSKITWTSLNTSIATVSPTQVASGSEVTITGISKGTTTIRASATISGQTYSKDCALTVSERTGTGTATLITSVSDLEVNEDYIIAATDYDLAMSTNQKTNNRGQAEITRNGSTISFGDDTQVFTLENGTKSNTYSFKDEERDGYIYAASSSSNNLKTEKTKSDNSSFTISFDNEVALFAVNGTNSHNVLKYNDGNSLFSCYSPDNTSMKDVSIYKVNSSGPVAVTGVSLNKTSTEIANGTSETLVATVEPSSAYNKNVTWSSSNAFVASVDNYGVVSALDEGNAVITVTTEDGGFTATCNVTVIEDEISNITIDKSNSKLDYYIDEQFSREDIVVLANYVHASPKVLDNDDLTFTGISENYSFIDGDISGKTFTVSYSHNSKTYEASETLSVSYPDGAIYRLSGSSSVSGMDTPIGSSASFSSTSGSVDLTANNHMILTLSGYDYCEISGISLLIKSNTYSGSGYVSAKIGDKVVATIGSEDNPLPFDDEEFFGKFSTSYRYLNLSLDSTYSVNKGEKITIQINSTQNSLHCKKMNVKYISHEPPTLKSISLSGSYQTTFTINTTFNHTGMIVTAHYSDGSQTDVTDLSLWSNPDMSKVGSKKVTVSYLDASVDYTINVIDRDTRYVKVTSQLSSWNGTYLLVYEVPNSDDALVWTGYDLGKCHTDAKIVDNTITNKPTLAATLTISSMTNGYSIRINGTKNHNKYIGGVSDAKGAPKNGLSFNNDPQVTTISYDATNKCTVINASNETKLQYNNTSGDNNERFRYYKSPQKNIQLYKYMGGNETSLDKAEHFSNKLYNCISCFNGTKTPELTGLSWNDLCAEFILFDDDIKNYLVNAAFVVDGDEVTPTGETTLNVANGVAKYDQLVSKYSFENFMNRNIPDKTKFLNGINDNNVNFVIIIVALATSSFTCCLCIIKHKRSKIRNE